MKYLHRVGFIAFALSYRGRLPCGDRFGLLLKHYSRSRMGLLTLRELSQHSGRFPYNTGSGWSVGRNETRAFAVKMKRPQRGAAM